MNNFSRATAALLLAMSLLGSSTLTLAQTTTAGTILGSALVITKLMQMFRRSR